ALAPRLHGRGLPPRAAGRFARERLLEPRRRGRALVLHARDASAAAPGLVRGGEAPRLPGRRPRPRARRRLPAGPRRDRRVLARQLDAGTGGGRCLLPCLPPDRLRDPVSLPVRPLVAGPGLYLGPGPCALGTADGRVRRTARSPVGAQPSVFG